MEPYTLVVTEHVLFVIVALGAHGASAQGDGRGVARGRLGAPGRDPRPVGSGVLGGERGAASPDSARVGLMDEMEEG